MTKRPDLTPHLHGLTPDPDAMTDARAFALMLPTAPRLAARLEDLLMTFAHFAQEASGPRLPGGHAEALNVFTFAASGLLAFLEDGHTDPWATLARARLWAVDKCQQATGALPLEAVEGLHRAMTNPHTLPAWADQQRQTGREAEAGRLAAWWAVSHVLEAAPSLEDGEAEDLTAATLHALARPTPAPTPRPDLFAAFVEDSHGLPSLSPFAAPAVHTAQYVTPGLTARRVTVHMGGGEDYEVSREDCALTPLPDGAAFLAVKVGTPDAVTVRLTPEDARTVCQVFEWEDGEGKDGQTSPLN